VKTEIAEPTVDSLLTAAVARLASPAAALEAELLLAEALGGDRSRLLAHPETPVPTTVVARFSEALERRRAGEPLAYLLGRREFYGRDFTVSPAVLVPRPESELLVELALAVLDPGDSLVDVGAGSGCLGLSVAAELPSAKVHLIERSSAALAIAEENRRRLGVRATLHPADLWPEALNLPAARTVVIANLPYLSEAAYRANPDLQFEPGEALRGGSDGLAVIRRLLRRLTERAFRPKALLLEISPEQDPAVRRLASRVEMHADLAGHPRVAAISEFSVRRA
jgi:release factor glutamine methyltransferase